MTPPEIIDITPDLTPDIAVFPGDTPLSRDVLLDINKGDNVTLSTLHATVHLGAHADGPNHYAKSSKGVSDIKLHHYLGPCRVIDVTAAKGDRITIADLTAPIDHPRVLLYTGSQPDKNTFPQDFKGLDPDLIDYLAANNVTTIGTDTPSVDTATSKDLPAHAACYKNRIAILEGLVLDHAPPGVYELIALPLKLIGFDASPVRAILRPLP